VLDALVAGNSHEILEAIVAILQADSYAAASVIIHADSAAAHEITSTIALHRPRVLVYVFCPPFYASVSTWRSIEHAAESNAAEIVLVATDANGVSGRKFGRPVIPLADRRRGPNALLDAVRSAVGNGGAG